MQAVEEGADWKLIQRKDGETAKKDEKGKDTSGEKKPAEKKPADKKPAEKK